MLCWNAQGYLLQHLSKKGQMQYITVFFLIIANHFKLVKVDFKKGNKVWKAGLKTLKGLNKKCMLWGMLKKNVVQISFHVICGENRI